MLSNIDDGFGSMHPFHSENFSALMMLMAFDVVCTNDDAISDFVNQSAISGKICHELCSAILRPCHCLICQDSGNTLPHDTAVLNPLTFSSSLLLSKAVDRDGMLSILRFRPAF